MNDVLVNPELVQSDGISAGALIRQARQSKGLHIAAVANAIKVTPQKLELLESDRIAELPGDAFARALAQTVCRYLKMDAIPVMALLPAPPVHGLDHMGRGLNQPFHEGMGMSRQEGQGVQILKNPVLLCAFLLVLAALGMYFAPQSWLPGLLARAPANAPANGVVVQSLPLAAPVVSDVAGTAMGVGSTLIEPAGNVSADTAVAVPPTVAPSASRGNAPIK
jgi:cytoskeleton protein RodZ